MTNNELRRRNKIRDQNGRQAPNKRRKDSKSSTTLQRSFFCLILSATIFTVFMLLYIDNIPWHIGHRIVDTIAMKFGYNKPVHAIVVDAGSTGSRVLAFTFHQSYFGDHLFLDDELFKYTKPGLSSFADNPQKVEITPYYRGVESLSNLLEHAKERIPKEYWNQTPLILKATAGLRMLPLEKAENLLNSVKDFFKKTPFSTTEQSVEIMDGIDEGIFSWFTVNYLLDLIHENPSKTVAALDLGGGSTQVTFAALTPASLQQKEYIHEALSPNGIIPVYTHSYLGLGLMAARKAIITKNQPNQINVTSECVNHIIKGRRFHFDNTDYYVSGPQKNYPILENIKDRLRPDEEVPIVDFDKCSKMISDYVVRKAKPPEELPTKTIFAFSYYFDRATEVGLIDETKGGQIRVDDFKTAAQKSCNEPNADQPFMCLDLSFIWVLLRKGFGLSGDTKVYLYKKIKGHEISWALGAAYNLLRG